MRSGQPGINGIEYANFEIQYPPLSEQERIAEALAEALSDGNGLIASLEKMIAKKKAIKQGAMQRLLTGKTRLPGFGGEGEWETVKIGDITEVYSGGTPDTSNPIYWGGNIPWMSS